jgi:hypothetical protein
MGRPLHERLAARQHEDRPWLHTDGSSKSCKCFIDGAWYVGTVDLHGDSVWLIFTGTRSGSSGCRAPSPSP